MGKINNVLLINATLQRFKLNCATTDFLFKHFKLSKHASSFFFVHFNSHDDVIMLLGTVVQSTRCQRSSHNDLFEKWNKFSTQFTKKLICDLISSPIFKIISTRRLFQDNSKYELFIYYLLLYQKYCTVLLVM